MLKSPYSKHLFKKVRNLSYSSHVPRLKDCEDIIDAEAGRVITLTNSSHYPRMLVNDPQVKELKVLQCKCDHHRECQVCKRRIDSEQES